MIDNGHMLLVVGSLLVSGLVVGHLLEIVGLPRVAGYVAAGMIFSSSALGPRLGFSIGAWAEPLTSASLGIVAYLIGGAITVGQVRRLGKVVLAGALGGTLAPTLIVAGGLWLVGLSVDGLNSWRSCLALGAIAATTDAAATVAVLHQYRASGPFSQTLLGVVAVDDAIGLFIFSLVLAVGFGQSAWQVASAATWDIVGALVTGTVGGFAVVWLGRRLRSRELILCALLGVIILLTALAEHWRMSVLLAAMTMGFVCRAAPRASSEQFFLPIERLEEFVFLIFFTLAGMHFRAEAFVTGMKIVAAFLVLRAIGKVFGAWAGVTIARGPKQVRRWLGLGLMPQAGVAIGLVLSLSREPGFTAAGESLVNIVLAATIVNELIGPIMTRLALLKVGELGLRRSGA